MQNTSTLWDESRLSRNNKKINGNQEESEWERGREGRMGEEVEEKGEREEEEKDGGRQRLPGDVSR